ncbi:UGT80B1 [Symbiodinium natans]|uniref:UGT80B1 protein n=1 Tax=Symbiodinium natans TaxID=878477 RepID=A0A812QZB2_9DINO|nr:UGT80B1 [Symbiodinium natans]
MTLPTLSAGPVLSGKLLVQLTPQRALFMPAAPGKGTVPPAVAYPSGCRAVQASVCDPFVVLRCQDGSLKLLSVAEGPALRDHTGQAAFKELAAASWAALASTQKGLWLTVLTPQQRGLLVVFKLTASGSAVSVEEVFRTSRLSDVPPVLRKTPAAEPDDEDAVNQLSPSWDYLRPITDVSAPLPRNSLEMTTKAEEETASVDLEELYSSLISEMLPTRAEILRATRASRALQCLGRPFRQGKGDFYDRSVPSTRISSFWSHSWHGAVWPKILTLLLMNNGTAAAVLSSASVVLVGFVYGSGVLPFFYLGWCCTTGALTYTLVMVFWRSRQLVFVDRICISQSDEELKGEALISLGAFLKCADSMLVLWDPTYVERLWCVFELAAFLHSRQRGMKPDLTIRPTVLGPAVLLILAQLFAANAASSVAWNMMGAGLEFYVGHAVLAIGTVVLAVHIGRSYCRSIAKLHEEVSGFRVDRLKSYCCSVDHHDPTSGEAMPCDRKIILQCVRTWFDTVQAFERRVQTEVLQILIYQLSNEVFSYWQAVVLTTPIAWRYADLGFDWVLAGDATKAVHNFMRGFTYWFAVSPTLTLLLVRLAYWTRKKQAYRLVDYMVSFLITLVGAAYYFAHQFWDLLLFQAIFPEMRIVAGLMYSIPAFGIALLVWRAIPKIPVHSTTAPRDCP